MIEQVRFYHIYDNISVRILRFFLLGLLLLALYFQLTQGHLPKLPLFFLSVYCMSELFFHFKLTRMVPEKTIEQAEDDAHLFDTFTKEALWPFITSAKTTDIIQRLLRFSQVRFMLQKIGSAAADVSLVTSLDKHELAKAALQVAKTRKGTFVTTMDVFVAFLLAREEESRFLLTHHVQGKDIYNILLWATLYFWKEEKHMPLGVQAAGGGVGDSLVVGWTPETKKFTIDITSQAFSHPMLLLGHEHEYDQLVAGLSKQENAFVVLVGEAGTGKQTLVESFAAKSFLGLTNKMVNHKKILQLIVGQLLAGAENQSALESRLSSLIEEVAHAGNVILYIPNFENILGSSSFQLDVSGALLPYLRSGRLPIIGSMTPESYKHYLEKNALKEIATLIVLQEPEKEIAIQMLFYKATQLETKYKVSFVYKALIRAIELADQYLPESFLPGSAVKLLEDAANKTSLSQVSVTPGTKKKPVNAEDIEHIVEQNLHIVISEPNKDEKDLLLHLEDNIHERVIDQQPAVTAVAEAMRRLRTGLKATNKPISFLFLGPTGVGKTETAKALAALYFGNEKKMIRLDMSEYTDEEGIKRLLGAAPGEGEERGELTEKMHDNPFSLLLLDEFEKANPKIHDLFLQVLDDGRLTDNKGKTVTFSSAIIIATSNAASEFVREAVTSGKTIDQQFHKELLEYLQTNRIFKPELLNRFDEIVTFKPLGKEDLHAIITLLLNELAQRLQEQDIILRYDEKLIEKIAKEGVDDQFGARPLRRYIQTTLEDLLAKRKLEDTLQRGSTVLATVDEQNTIVLLSE